MISLQTTASSVECLVQSWTMLGPRFCRVSFSPLSREVCSNTEADFTLRIPKPGWRNASTPTSILTEWGDEEGGIMGTFSFLHNIHCLVSYTELIMEFKEPRI